MPLSEALNEPLQVARIWLSAALAGDAEATQEVAVRKPAEVTEIVQFAKRTSTREIALHEVWIDDHDSAQIAIVVSAPITLHETAERSDTAQLVVTLRKRVVAANNQSHWGVDDISFKKGGLEDERIQFQKDHLRFEMTWGGANLEPDRSGSIQVHFQLPPNTKPILATSKDEECIVHERVNLLAGKTHYFTFLGMPVEQGIQLSGSIELLPLNPKTQSYLAHNAIPIQVTRGDIDQRNSSNFIEKAVYLSISGGGIETLVSTLDAPVPDLIGEARRRGELFAVLRLRMNVSFDKVPNVETEDSEQYPTADETRKSFQRQLTPTDRTIQIFALTEELAKKNGQVPNLLHLLSAVLRNNGPAAVAVGEVPDHKELTLKELIRRCDEAATSAHADSATEWTQVRNAAEATVKQWKHDYLSTEHLLMALMVDGTTTSQFFRQHGIETEVVSDKLYQMLFAAGVQAQPAPTR